MNNIARLHCRSRGGSPKGIHHLAGEGKRIGLLRKGRGELLRHGSKINRPSWAYSGRRISSPIGLRGEGSEPRGNEKVSQALWHDDGPRKRKATALRTLREDSPTGMSAPNASSLAFTMAGWVHSNKRCRLVCRVGPHQQLGVLAIPASCKAAPLCMLPVCTRSSNPLSENRGSLCALKLALKSAS